MVQPPMFSLNLNYGCKSSVVLLELVRITELILRSEKNTFPVFQTVNLPSKRFQRRADDHRTSSRHQVLFGLQSNYAVTADWYRKRLSDLKKMTSSLWIQLSCGSEVTSQLRTRISIMYYIANPAPEPVGGNRSAGTTLGRRKLK